MNDNTTPMAAVEYDKKINNTIPYYTEFYQQTLDVVEQCKFDKMDWLDLGCGTGSLEEQASLRFRKMDFVLVDPSEKMLEQAKEKLKNREVQYICAGSTDIQFENCFHIVTAIQSHHYMQEDEEIKDFELLRWERYHKRHGKAEEEAREHNARCGVNYFPLTMEQHIKLLKSTGFRKVHVFWVSYMQMGIYAIK